MRALTSAATTPIGYADNSRPASRPPPSGSLPSSSLSTRSGATDSMSGTKGADLGMAVSSDGVHGICGAGCTSESCSNVVANLGAS
ncbi:hypothetical protein CDL15_Pgr029072 [Punica granatum]|uniref:Uncharacterized protein n=1 Tax=Punica granatum TaxID=22663 RepID=A0A218XLU3_PUNGR|nr:hypothetical protein CDL15_Pgr029072 [Punica granatum]